MGIGFTICALALTQLLAVPPEGNVGIAATNARLCCFLLSPLPLCKTCKMKSKLMRPSQKILHQFEAAEFYTFGGRHKWCARKIDTDLS